MKSRLRKFALLFVGMAACAAFVFSGVTQSPSIPRGKIGMHGKAVLKAPPGTYAASVYKLVSLPHAKIPLSFTKLRNKYNLVTIPTYDGSYQLTHPKVLYFPKGWNGYQYWMSMTPYPYENDDYENPSIVVSNDGTTWGIPAGLKNPVSGLPSDVASGGHYSDPQLVMRGNTMELWYRYNPARRGKKLPDNSVNIYYRKTSRDGVHWTGAKKLLQSRHGYLSLCVNYEKAEYKTWYATYGGDLCYSESRDAVDWSAPVRCSVPLPAGFEPYHQDMIRYGSEYYLLQTAEKPSNYTFQLFLLQSEDGIHFSGAQPVYPSKDMALWKKISFYRSTLFVKDNKLNLYVSMIIPHLKWYITQCQIPIPKPVPGQQPGKAGSAVKI